MNILQDVAKTIRTILGPMADNLGKATGFIKRERKFTGSKFIKTLVFGWMQKPEVTKEELTQSGLLNEVKISVQGLDKRFTSAAAEFSFDVLSAAVTEVVKAPTDVPLELLTRFSAVVLYDTTTINLPDELFKIWPGTGGNGPTSRSALKGFV